MKKRGTGAYHGFNGKEQDNDIGGTGVDYDYGARIYDARVGRFLSVDPLQIKYPQYSSYCFTFDNPNIFIDPDGREVVIHKATTSNDGPLIASSVHDLGNTKMSLGFLFNKKTNSFDLIVDQHIQYAAALGVGTFMTSGRSLEQLNPGLTLSVTTHEGVHYDRNVIAAKSEIEMKDLSGKVVKGTADVLLTNFNTEINAKENEIKVKTQKDVVSKKEAITNANASDEDKAAALKTLEDSEKKAYQNLDNQKDQAIKQYANDLIKAIFAKAAPLQQHDGPNGVNDEAASKMPPAAREYQLGKQIKTGNPQQGTLKN